MFFPSHSCSPSILTPFDICREATVYNSVISRDMKKFKFVSLISKKPPDYISCQVIQTLLNSRVPVQVTGNYHGVNLFYWMGSHGYCGSLPFSLFRQ